MRESNLLVAIPAFNEVESLPVVLAKLKSNPLVTSILVIDDGSRDGTYEVACASGVNVIRHPYNMGVGAAMRTAFIYAKRNNFDLIVQIDADGQHDDTCLGEFLPLMSYFDVVVGSRFLNSESFKVGAGRYWAMKLLRKSLRVLSGIKISDSTSGFRMSNKRAIKVFSEKYPAEYLGDTVTSLVIADRYGLKVGEVSVVMHARQGGEPSQSFLKSAFHFLRTLAVLILTRFQEIDRPLKSGISG
jgi:glycosyltransferase involved in cell wall biosynthesis